MKKLFKSQEYRRYNKKRARKSFARGLNYKKWKNCQRRSMIGIPMEEKKEHFASRGHTIIDAPVNFSFLNNSNGVICFISRIKSIYDKKTKVYINLKKVEEIDYGAITVLLSIMFEFKIKKIGFNGNFPKNIEAKKLLIESDFFKYLDKSVHERVEYSIGKENQIFTQANKKVIPELGFSIMEETSKTIWGYKRALKGLQRTLLELMQNTNNHATLGDIDKERWWLSVNHDSENKKVSFVFVDYGIGIFESLKSKPAGNKWFGWFDKIKDVLVTSRNCEILELLLKGEIHKSVTGDHFRGKGLPGIKQVLDRNQISKLYVISNNAFSNVQDGIYKDLEKEFSGTFLYWEINEESEAHEWIN